MEQQRLKRLLGRGFSVATCVGLIVGLGILRTPGEIAEVVSNPWAYIGLWLAGGAFVFLTVLTVAELFAMTPKSGGVYTLVRHAYGPYPGFVIGWTDWMALCASNALKAVVLAEYAALLFPALSDMVTPLALLVSSVFATLQLGGVRLGANIQQTAAVGFGFIMMGLALALFYAFLSDGTATVAMEASTSVSTIAQYGPVVAAVIYTYDGWFAPTYFGGEMKSGARASADGAIRGILIVIAFYLILNLALVLAVPLQALVGHDLALAGAIEIVYGPGAGSFVVVAALFILLAHQNLLYMNTSRTLYALSVDGLGTGHATGVSGKGTPTGAVLFSWLATVLIISAGGFNLLLSLTAFLFVVNYVAVMIGVFRLRQLAPDEDRPYRAWGYPVVGVILTLGWAALAVFVAVTNVRSVGYAIALVAVSAPAYWWLKRRRSLGAEQPVA